MLEIKHLKKEYKTRVILEDVNLKIEVPEIIGLVGTNGSGKTTLLKCVGNIIRDYQGEILVDTSLSFSLENPTFFDSLTVKANLEVFESLLAKKGKFGVKSALEKVGLSQSEQKKFRELSLGMKQKLAIARCLLSDSKIILLDEPFNGLDFVTKEELKNILVELHTEGRTIIVSSHILEELSEICDKIWYLKNGKVKSRLNLQGDERNYTVRAVKRGNIKEVIERFDGTVLEEMEEEVLFKINLRKERIFSVLKEMIEKKIEVLEYYDSTNRIKDVLIQMESEE